MTTTRRTGQRGVPLLLVGCAVLLAIGVFGVRALVSGASGSQQSTALASGSGAAGPRVDAAAAVSRLNAVAPQSSGITPDATQTPPPTQRQWDTNVPGIVNDPVLASRLDQALSGVDGHVGVVVKDLGSGRGAVLNGNTELQSASLYKLPVLYTVFQLGLSMSEQLTISEDALSYDSGTMELGPGETLSVAELLERMVTLSDNTSAVMLGGRVGAPNIDANLAALGMSTTHYSLERMTTSALDMLHLTELIADGKAVSPAASADMVHLLLRQRVNDRLPRLLSDDVQVAHKTGNLPGVVNDVGVLYGPNSTVAVAALVSDTTDETAAATAIAQIGLVANSYFEDQPVVQDRPEIPAAPSRPVPPVWREPRPPTPTPRPIVAVVPTLQRQVQVQATPRTAQVETSPTVAAETVGASPTAAPTTAALAVVAATPTARPAQAQPTVAAAMPTRPPAPPATATPPPAAPPPTPAPPPPATKAPAAPPPPAQPTAGRANNNAPGATVTPVRR